MLFRKNFNLASVQSGQSLKPYVVISLQVQTVIESEPF